MNKQEEINENDINTKNSNVKFASYLSKFKLKIFLVLFLTLLDTIIVIASPRVISSIIDNGIATKSREQIMQNGIYLLLFSLFSIVFSVITTYVAAQIGYGITALIQKDIFKKLLNFSFKNLDKFSTPTILTRITNDSDSIGNAIVFTVRMGLQAPIMFIFAIFMSYQISSDLSKIFLVIIPLLIIVIMVLFKITSPIFKESQERVDGINGVIGENIRGIRTVKTYTREEHEVTKFMKDNKLLRNVKLKVVYIMTILEPIIGVLINAALIGVLYFGGNLVFSDKLSNGQLIAFISYTSQIFTGLFLMAGILMTVFPSIISFGRIKELLNTHSEITEKGNAIDNIPSGSKLDLELKNVSYSYSNSKNNTLENVSLKVPFGSSLGIVGMTGSRKNNSCITYNKTL
ncbi:MAG: ABC transporter ATP-binding protein [Clostridiales bacterium]|nr:ABC transporter ATP-binding protein [Clostridiales bacterium]